MEIDKIKKSYIALGSFDGLHLGHVSLIDKIVTLAKENKGTSIVYTFKNHPRAVINPLSPPKLLMDNDDKISILKRKGVDLIYFEEFNKDYMKISPEDFIKRLCDKFNVKGIVVGFNYKFGFKNLGNTKILKELQEKYGYELYIMNPCEFNNEIVSSTRIREDLLLGKVEEAQVMLNRPYKLKGKVVLGRRIGSTIGFPTANIDVRENSVLPKIGVYYTNVKWNNKVYRGITSVGNNPTVNGERLTIETNILDFSKDIYDENIEVFFIKKIRDEKKFNSVEELANQLEKDKEYAKTQKIIVT